MDGESALKHTAKSMWRSGGIRAYYRGLTVRLLTSSRLVRFSDVAPLQLGLIGVFPYSAIDMSTFEAL